MIETKVDFVNLQNPHMQMAVVTTAPLMQNVAQAQQQQQQYQQQSHQQQIVSTTNSIQQGPSVVSSSGVVAGAGITQVRPLQMTTSVRGTMMTQTPVSTPTSSIPNVRPNLQQMPPSSAHQANVGIPGGFNPREAMTFQGLQGASYSNEAARYPNPNPATTGTQNPTSSTNVLPVPPMPPVVSTVSAPVLKTTGQDAVNDIKSTMSLNCPVSATDVLNISSPTSVFH